jgi:uncharacterized protein (AIM24 family)
MIRNHEIDYKIFGEELQYVQIELDPGETAVAEPGAFMMMDDGISMQTIFGDGSQQRDNSLVGQLFSAGKRLLVGENLFMTAFTNTGSGKKHISFAAPYTGKVVALDLLQLGGKVIAQKDAFLCAAKGVSIGIEFQRKLGTGLFGGEGFHNGEDRRRRHGISACRRICPAKGSAAGRTAKDRYWLHRWIYRNCGV